MEFIDAETAELLTGLSPLTLGQAAAPDGEDEAVDQGIVQLFGATEIESSADQPLAPSEAEFISDLVKIGNSPANNTDQVAAEVDDVFELL